MRQKIRVFSLADKKRMHAAEMKITKLYAFHFASGPDDSTFASALYEKKAKQMVTIPDRSEGIVNVSAELK